MNPQNALAKYTAAVQAVKDHTEENKSVFNKHAEILGTLIDAENELRDAVATSGQGINNGAFNVIVTPQTQTFADIDEIDKLVATGQIQAPLRQQIVKTIQRPPRITISEVKEVA